MSGSDSVLDSGVVGGVGCWNKSSMYYWRWIIVGTYEVVGGPEDGVVGICGEGAADCDNGTGCFDAMQ